MKTKSFDCLEMKERAQQVMQKRLAGLSHEQQREAIKSGLVADKSSVGRLWRALDRRVKKTGACRVAEDSPSYVGGER